jgi:hypothetical protein
VVKGKHVICIELRIVVPVLVIFDFITIASVIISMRKLRMDVGFRIARTQVINGQQIDGIQQGRNCIRIIVTAVLVDVVIGAIEILVVDEMGNPFGKRVEGT